MNAISNESQRYIAGKTGAVYLSHAVLGIAHNICGNQSLLHCRIDVISVCSMYRTLRYFRICKAIPTTPRCFYKIIFIEY